MLTTEITDQSSVGQRTDYCYSPTVTSQVPQIGMNLAASVATHPVPPPPPPPIIYQPPPTTWAITANPEVPLWVYPVLPHEACTSGDYGCFYSNDNSETNITQMPISYAQSFPWQHEPFHVVPLQVTDGQQNFAPTQLYAQQAQFWPQSYANHFIGNQGELQNQSSTWDTAYNPGLYMPPKMPFHGYKEINGGAKCHNYRSFNGNKQGKITSKQPPSSETSEKQSGNAASINEQVWKEKQEIANMSSKVQGNKHTQGNVPFEQNGSTQNNESKVLNSIYKELEELLVPFMLEKDIQNLLDALKNGHEAHSFTLVDVDKLPPRIYEQLQALLNSLKAITLLVASMNDLKNKLLIQSTKDANWQSLENKVSNLVTAIFGKIMEPLRNISQLAKPDRPEGNTKTTPPSRKSHQQRKATTAKKKQERTPSPHDVLQGHS